MKNLKPFGKLIQFLNTNKGVAFVGTTYTNKDGEKSKYVFNAGASYQNAVKKDIEFVKVLDVETLDTEFSLELMEEAKEAILKSLIKPSYNHSQAQKDAYHFISNNLKVHKEKGTLMVYGLLHSKTVIEPIEYKATKSRPLTLAKKAIEKELKSKKYRQFIINEADSFRLNGESIEFDS